MTGNQVHEFVHKHIVKTVHFAADRSKLATAGHEGILRIFDVASPGSAPTEVDCEGGGGVFSSRAVCDFSTLPGTMASRLARAGRVVGGRGESKRELQ